MNHSGRQYSQLEQHEPLLWQTLNRTGTQYNKNNMNHFSVKPKTVPVDNIAN